MKLVQLRFLAAVAQNGLNITLAANKLSTTQPAVSKQLRLLEDELGFNIFVRSGRALTRITPPGERVVQCALRIVREAQNIKGIAAEHKNEGRGTLSIGTTHTQARYVLPPVIREFRIRYPDVQFHLHQGTSEQIAEMAQSACIDLAIATGARDLFSQFVLLPCYRWHRRIIVPAGHPLERVEHITLKHLAKYPIVTYVFSFSGPSSLHDAFAAEGLRPNIALTARDADVIKTYVRLGLGVGIIAEMALDAESDSDLLSIDASHLFPMLTTWIGFARGMLLRRYMHEFISLLAPHLDRSLVDRAAQLRTQSEVDALFSSISLPTWIRTVAGLPQRGAAHCESPAQAHPAPR
ncbi:MAG: HTH-type transcriptional regulator CysB [Steroidobacteraceae bacterium]|nr:HTH-type transcriptional regulator CysB [Steroidobacteraceae bacterium]